MFVSFGFSSELKITHRGHVTQATPSASRLYFIRIIFVVNDDVNVRTGVSKSNLHVGLKLVLITILSSQVTVRLHEVFRVVVSTACTVTSNCSPFRMGNYCSLCRTWVGCRRSLNLET